MVGRARFSGCVHPSPVFLIGSAALAAALRCIACARCCAERMKDAESLGTSYYRNSYSLYIHVLYSTLLYSLEIY